MLLAAYTVVGCAEKHSHEHKEAHEEEEANIVMFTEAQGLKAGLQTEQAVKEPFGPVIRTTAQILTARKDEHVIIAKTSGTVLFSGIDVLEGKEVKAGQVLFSVYSGEMIDNNLVMRYTEAESNYKRTKAEYERKKDLADKRLVSTRELLQAETDFINAETVYEIIKRNFSSGAHTVKSPINGYITDILVQNGQYAEAGQPLAEVSQNKELYIRAEVQTRYYEALEAITTVNIRTLRNRHTFTLEELEGQVVSYGKTADADNPLIPVILKVKNKKELMPAGSFVELFIRTQTDRQALTIPKEAVIEEMGAYFVFVETDEPEHYEKRAVVTGATDGLRIAILEGLQEGETVVCKGAVNIKLAQSSGALDTHAGHVH